MHGLARVELNSPLPQSLFMLFTSTQGKPSKTLAYILARLDLNSCFYLVKEGLLEFTLSVIDVADGHLCLRSDYSSHSLAQVELNFSLKQSYFCFFTLIRNK